MRESVGIIREAGASAAGVADGQAALTIGDRRSIRALGLANRNRILRRVMLGLPGGSAGAAVGTLLFDNYASTP